HILAHLSSHITSPLLLPHHAHPPHLPSFPTRRSSDLAYPGPQFRLVPELPALDERITRRRRRRETLPALDGVAAWQAVRRLVVRSEEHTSELQSHLNLVCRLLLEKKKNNHNTVLQYTD